MSRVGGWECLLPIWQVRIFKRKDLGFWSSYFLCVCAHIAAEWIWHLRGRTLFDSVYLLLKIGEFSSGTPDSTVTEPSEGSEEDDINVSLCLYTPLIMPSAQ